jgi:hypothetical protein
MSDKFMLGVGLAHELEMAFERTGWTNAEIKELTNGDTLASVRRLLRGELKVKAAKLLWWLIRVPVQATKKFVAKDHFLVDTSATAKVTIGYLGTDFMANFLGKIERNVPAIDLVAYRLGNDSGDQPVLDQLGEKTETTLAQLWQLLFQQPRGEAGMLLTNDGYADIFYIKDMNDKLWAVHAAWRAGFDDWSVHASSVRRSAAWRAGSRVFSRE